MVSGPPPWVGVAGFCVTEDAGALDELDELDELDDMERRRKHQDFHVRKVEVVSKSRGAPTRGQAPGAC